MSVRYIDENEGLYLNLQPYLINSLFAPGAIV